MLAFFPWAAEYHCLDKDTIVWAFIHLSLPGFSLHMSRSRRSQITSTWNSQLRFTVFCSNKRCYGWGVLCVYRDLNSQIHADSYNVFWPIIPFKIVWVPQYFVLCKYCKYSKGLRSCPSTNKWIISDLLDGTYTQLCPYTIVLQRLYYCLLRLYLYQ